MDDRNAPATKGDIADLEEKLQQLGGQLRAEVSHGYNDILERIHDGQTELLKAFYGYAQGNNTRVSELEGTEQAFRRRLATMEDRILEVERRLNMPPAA
jgi:hypothetical protein